MSHMLNRLIRWLALAEIGRVLAERDAAAVKLLAELAEIRATADACQNIAYANGFNAGRAVGQGEMLTHLRGDQAERATSDMITRRAVEMVH